MRACLWWCWWTGVVLLLTTNTAPSQGLLFTGTSAVVGTGILATLGLIGAVGIGDGAGSGEARGATDGGHGGGGSAGCAQLLVCQLAATPPHLLQPQQLAVLAFARFVSQKLNTNI
ncbi:hypothetical protein Pcinc_003624 [Petrolisthes cinctipes]|uniref:Secreted protein n=1 Tax=Petrolisthes cinctipes TaxID=88211 RepID=A0AAE1GN72_PETCI|nr:hypothetical protein Pcinc_003624 [Petrolisthes cinctipes]